MRAKDVDVLQLQGNVLSRFKIMAYSRKSALYLVFPGFRLALVDGAKTSVAESEIYLVLVFDVNGLHGGGSEALVGGAELGKP